MKRLILMILVSAIITVSVPVYAEVSDDRVLDIENTVSELQILIDDCKIQGYDIDYEIADFSVIKDFVGYVKDDISWGDTERAEYVLTTLEEMSADLKTRLNNILAETETPVRTIKNTADNYGGTANGDFVDTDGNPIIYNGYGAFTEVKNAVGKLQDFGADIIQIEIGPRHVLSEVGAVNGWGMVVSGSDASSVSVADGRGGDGTDCLKVVNSEDSYITVNQGVEIKPDTTYVLSFSARTVGAGQSFFSANGWEGNRVYLSEGTTAWTEYECEYTTGHNADFVELMFFSGKTATAIYVDNIRFIEKETEENIVQNGDFQDCGVLTSENFSAVPTQINNRITRTLNKAYENGIMVNLLISPHYFPDWILEKYPDAALNPDCGIPYDINNQYIREAFELYIRAIIETVGEHPALHSICIANEPYCDTRKTTGLDDEFSDYLASVYDSIDDLNKIYDSEYGSFDDVSMPSDSTKNAAFYDWVQFNDNYTAQSYKFLADMIKKYAPDIPVHAKIMSIFNVEGFIESGIDPEDFAEFCDYSGHDSYGFYNGSNASGLFTKLKWYDFLNSISPQKPIINSEDHIIRDRNENFEKEHTIHIGADIWQGAVHGRDASILWLWQRSEDKTSNTYGNILYRPDALSEVSRVSLDLNRLSNQVAALQKAKPELSILYSQTSIIYKSSALNVLGSAYEAGICSGVKTQFITERQLENGIMPEGVLVLPAITHISDEAWNTIADFKDRGGIIVALGENNLLYDEHNVARSTVIETDYITDCSKLNSVSDIINEALGDKRPVDVYGIPVNNVGKICAEYDGKTIWNLCNYSWSSDKEIIIDGVAVDLISGEKYIGVVKLKPFKPVLLEFADAEFSMQCIAEKYEKTGKVIINFYADAINAGFRTVTVEIRNEEGRVFKRFVSKNYFTTEDFKRISYEFAVPFDNFFAEISVSDNVGNVICKETVQS